jgi:hypothetical protein
MASRTSQKKTKETAKARARSVPRSIEIAARGISTASDFSQLMSALMSDVIEGLMTPSVSNAAVNAGGKLLKAVEMQIKYGTKNGTGVSDLVLSHEDVKELKKLKATEIA